MEPGCQKQGVCPDSANPQRLSSLAYKLAAAYAYLPKSLSEIPELFVAATAFSHVYTFMQSDMKQELSGLRFCGERPRCSKGQA